MAILLVETNKNGTHVIKTPVVAVNRGDTVIVVNTTGGDIKLFEPAEGLVDPASLARGVFLISLGQTNLTADAPGGDYFFEVWVVADHEWAETGEFEGRPRIVIMESHHDVG